MTSPAQMLVTARDFTADSFRLLELNADVEQALQAGDKVFIVGAPAERAVLCTPNKSFYLTKEDTSNLRLLTEHTTWEAPDTTAAPTCDEIIVRGSATFHYLLQPKMQDAMRLKTLLMEAPYEPATREPLSPASVPPKRARRHALHTTSDLVVALQASEREVLDMLAQLHAFEDAGTWRVLGAAFQARVFGDMLDAAVQHDMLDVLAAPGVPLARFQAAVEHPVVAVRQCARIYGTVALDDSGAERCVLDGPRVARFCAQQLFEEQAARGSGGGDDGNWALDQFLDKWALRVPDGVSVGVELLRGLALIKPAGRGKLARAVYFNESDLPHDAKQRFEKLFAAQEKWTLPQLEPFIQSLVVPGTTQAALLLKHTRSSRQINSTERLYSRR